MELDFTKNELNIEDIIKDIKHTLSVDRNNDLYHAVALAGEVGEYCNFIKKENRSNGYRFKYQNETESELMDCLYYVFSNCLVRGVDISSAWHKKMNHNELKYGRPITKRPFECECDDCDKIRKKNTHDTTVIEQIGRASL